MAEILNYIKKEANTNCVTLECGSADFCLPCLNLLHDRILTTYSSLD
jgi:hypothetical protein